MIEEWKDIPEYEGLYQVSNLGNIKSFKFGKEKLLKLNALLVAGLFTKLDKMENLIMKFKDAPIGARFHFIGDDAPKDVYVKIHAYDDGLVVKWNGNVEGHQSHCCWLDEENGYDFDTEIELL